MSTSASDYFLSALGSYGLDISPQLSDQIVSWSANYLQTNAGINILDGATEAEMTALENYFKDVNNATAYGMAAVNAPWFPEWQAAYMKALQDGTLDPDGGAVWDQTDPPEVVVPDEEDIEDAIEWILGTTGNDVLQGTDLADWIEIGQGNDTAQGGNGDDYFLSLAGLNQIFGGSGTNTVEYQTNFLSVALQYVGNYVEAFVNSGHVDNLHEISFLKFNDLEISTDSAIELRDAFQAVAGLYSFLLGREADESGLKYWVNDVVSGNSIMDTAMAIAQSQEFGDLDRFSQASDDDFLNALYQDFLGREADQDGFNYWISQLENGAERLNILTNFAISAEYQGNISDLVNSYLANISVANDTFV